MCLTLGNAAAVFEHRARSAPRGGYTETLHHIGHLSPGDLWRPATDRPPHGDGRPLPRRHRRRRRSAGPDPPVPGRCDRAARRARSAGAITGRAGSHRVSRCRCRPVATGAGPVRLLDGRPAGGRQPPSEPAAGSAPANAPHTLHSPQRPGLTRGSPGRPWPGGKWFGRFPGAEGRSAGSRGRRPPEHPRSAGGQPL